MSSSPPQPSSSNTSSSPNTYSSPTSSIATSSSLSSPSHSYEDTKNNIIFLIKYSSQHILLTPSSRNNPGYLAFISSGNRIFEIFADRVSTFILNNLSKTSYTELATWHHSTPLRIRKGTALMVATGIVAFALKVKSDFLTWVSETCCSEILFYATKINERIMRLDSALALILLDEDFPDPFCLTKTLSKRINELALFLNHPYHEIRFISLNPRQASNDLFFYIHYWDNESFTDLENNVIFTDDLYNIFLHSPFLPSNEQ